MFIFILTTHISYIIRKSIYIPLCLYLYRINFHNGKCRTEFTFHYVYIYILKQRVTTLWTLIYIPLCLYLYLQRLILRVVHHHLHSTMFIFISYRYEKIKHCVSNLHSTMFIFILGNNTLPEPVSTFTFHYVYIYIDFVSVDDFFSI